MRLAVILLSAALLAACTTTMPAADRSTAAAPSLSGAAWTVERINDAPVLDGARPTLTFGSDGRASGNASCNSFGTTYRASGNALTFSPIVATKRACAEANRMQQESAFLDLLGRTARFDIRPDGSLVLETNTAQTLLARRP